MRIKLLYTCGCHRTKEISKVQHIYEVCVDEFSKDICLRIGYERHGQMEVDEFICSSFVCEKEYE